MLRADVKSGIKVGLSMATVLAAIVVFVRLAFGAAPFDRLGIGWLWIVVTYYIAFVLGGAAQGALQPVRATLLGALASGVLFVLPIYLSFALLLGLAGMLFSSRGANLALGLVVSLFVGVVFAFFVILPEADQQATDRREPDAGGPTR